MEELDVFTAKTVDEAIMAGLKAQDLTLDEAEITVLEEGKKKLFGSVKAKVRVRKKLSDAKRAAEFIDGLLELLGVTALSEVTEDDENIKIEVKTTNSARVIGKRGDVLDAIQCMAGAVANTGRDEYVKVVVDCESYRVQREETLKALALKLAKKAVEKGRKMTLEPMNPYERRIIHSALSDNTEVKTVSEGKEPNRYIAVIPNNAKPFDKGLRYGEKKPFGDKPSFDKRGGNRNGRDDRRNDRRGGGRPSSGGGAKRGKKEIYFVTFLGNSGAKDAEASAPLSDDKTEE
ncbi:MAG: Jag N-terminal domain-containing protein [Clostridia bacterium]|nr:Jag N-terminal domain-containing protein [Clostridia bacterium]